MTSDVRIVAHPVIYEFGDYILDTSNRTVRRGQQIVELTPKQFQTLLVLVENHDRIMSKEELLNSIWPAQFVEESNVIQNICVLRKSLGETAHGTKYIETFPGRGYRFSESVTVVQRFRESNELHSAERPPSPQESLKNGTCGLDAEIAPISTKRRRSLPSRRYLVVAIGFLLVGILLATIAVRQKHRGVNISSRLEPIARSSELTTLIRMDGAQFEPSWSQDGRRIAFVYSAPDGSGSAIYMQSLQDSRPRRVVYGPGEFSSPVWSPGGKFLAYVHINQNSAEIDILNVTLSSERRLIKLFPHRYQLNYRHLDWSPDGNFLVVDDKTIESNPLSLYLVSVKNGEKIRLTYPDTDIVGDVSPRFSPDGTQVVFIRIKYHMQNDIFVVPVTGGEQRRLTKDSSLLADVDWKNAHTVIFTAKMNTKYRFWSKDLSSVSPSPMLASSIAAEMPIDFSIAHRSHQVVFSAYEPDLNIWSVNLLKKRSSDAVWTPVIQTAGQDSDPSYSPDGKTILFHSDVSGQTQLWVCNADGSGAFRVNTGAIVPRVSAWSPDSHSIVFSSSGGLYAVMASPMPVLRQITSLPISHPSYSVDGKWLFAIENYFIYRLPASGGPLTRIVEEGGPPIVQSRDGRYLYFGHGRMDTTITRLDLKTKEQKVIIHSLMPGYRASWALASNGIFFLTGQFGRPVIAYHSFLTGREHVVTPFIGSLPLFSVSGFSISPDGGQLLVVRADPAFANLQTTTLW